MRNILGPWLAGPLAAPMALNGEIFNYNTTFFKFTYQVVVALHGTWEPLVLKGWDPSNRGDSRKNLKRKKCKNNLDGNATIPFCYLMLFIDSITYFCTCSHKLLHLYSFTFFLTFPFRISVLYSFVYSLYILFFGNGVGSRGVARLQL